MSDDLQKPWTFEQPICREIGGFMFYMSDEDDPEALDSNVRNTQEAKKICLKCEHVVECAEWGIHHEKFGVWGGLSPYELIAIRRRRNITIKTIDLPRVL